MSGDLTHDGYVQRLAQMTEPTTMFTLNAVGEVVPHFEVGPDVIKVLLVEEASLRNQVDRIASEIMHWGRIAARQTRCHVVRMRKLRQWKAQVELSFRKAQDVEGKKTTEALVEAHYRTAPDYEAVQTGVEECQEAALVADAIHQAFKEKKSVLVKDVYRAPDGSMQRLSP